VTLSPPESDIIPSPPTEAQPAPESAPALALLKSAWEKHDVLDRNASHTQRRFFFLRRLFAYLSVLVVLLAVVQPMIMNQVILNAATSVGGESADLKELHDTLSGLALVSLWQRYPHLALANFLLILLPVLTTGLRAFAVKFDRGNSWVLLRGSAEAIKMEIFYYRTGVKPYDLQRQQVLAAKLQMISERVKGSAVHQTAFNPYEGESPKRLEMGLVFLLLSRPLLWLNHLCQKLWEFLFKWKEVPATPTAQLSPAATEELMYQCRYADLTAAAYIQFRLEDQFDWYRYKAKGYSRQHQVFQTGVYIFGGVGTLMAATGLQNWVAVTAAIAASLVNFLEYRRIEVTLVGYNQAADALYDIRTWWYSLSETEKADPKNFEKLVVNTEESIRSEHSSWLQDMQDRLANLYESSSDPRQKSEAEAEVEVLPGPSSPPLLDEATSLPSADADGAA
jgi:hypothetical protein